MRLRYQRILYLSFIAFFVVGLPLIILYATGYRYNVKKHRLEKTGIIVIESNPTGATVTLNDQTIGVTPQRILGVRPDEYTIVLTKTGYFPWQKKVTVTSNTTSFANDGFLIRQNEPVLKIPGTVATFSVSPDRALLLTITATSTTPAGQISLTDLRTMVTTPIAAPNIPTTTAIVFSGWSARGEYAAIRTAATTNQTFIVDAQLQTIRPLNQLTTATFTDLRWDSQNGSRLYLVQPNGATQVNLDTRTTRVLKLGAFADLYSADQTLYTLQESAGDTLLAQRSVDQPDVVAGAVRLPTSGRYRFVPSEQNTLLISNPTTRELLLVRPSIFSTDTIADHIVFQGRADTIRWSPNGSHLLIKNDVELLTIDPEAHDQQTIVRQSASIPAALWYADGNHAIYQLGQTVRMIETQANSKNDWELASADELTDIALSVSGDTLYLAGTIGEQTGVFTVQLR